MATGSRLEIMKYCQLPGSFPTGTGTSVQTRTNSHLPPGVHSAMTHEPEIRWVTVTSHNCLVSHAILPVSLDPVRKLSKFMLMTIRSPNLVYQPRWGRPRNIRKFFINDPESRGPTNGSRRPISLPTEFRTHEMWNDSPRVG